MVKFKERKHSKQELHEMKQKRKAKTVAIVISAIFIISAFGIMLSNDSTNYNYSFNGVNFIISDNLLYVSNKDKFEDIPFRYIPEENYLSYFDPSKEEILSLIYDGDYIVISQDPNSNVTEQDLLIQGYGVQELSQTLQAKGKEVFFAFETEYGTTPVYPCENATQESPVILFLKDENESITISENPSCIKITAMDENIIKITDYLKFAIIENE